MYSLSHYLQGLSYIPDGCFGFLNHQQYGTHHPRRVEKPPPKIPSSAQFRDLRFDLPCTRPMNQIRGFEADHKESTTNI